MFAAEQDGRLAGFAILGPEQRDESVEMSALFVDAGRRGTGVGSRLFDMAAERSRERGHAAMVIHSNPTVSTVDFYMRRGAAVIGMLDRRVVSHLEGDVILAKFLRE